MKITKKEREEAILWLELAAEGWIAHGGPVVEYAYLQPGLAREAETAVSAAFDHAYEENDTRRQRLPSCPWCTPVDYLEAAALIRDGWNPGDPVDLLNHGGE